MKRLIGRESSLFGRVRDGRDLLGNSLGRRSAVPLVPKGASVKHWKTWVTLLAMGKLLLLGAFADVALGPGPSWAVVIAQGLVIVGGSLLAGHFSRKSGLPGPWAAKSLAVAVLAAGGGALDLSAVGPDERTEAFTALVVSEVVAKTTTWASLTGACSASVPDMETKVGGPDGFSLFQAVGGHPDCSRFAALKATLACSSCGALSGLCRWPVNAHPATRVATCLGALTACLLCIESVPCANEQLVEFARDFVGILESIIEELQEWISNPGPGNVGRPA